MMNYTEALRILQPDAQCCSTNDSVYESLQRTDGLPIPSRAELELAWANYTPPLRWSRTELLALFTREETRLIRSVAMADPESASAIVLDELERRPIDHIYRSDSQTLADLLAALVTEGTLQAQRPAQILAGVTPS